MKKTTAILNAILIAATLISDICYYQFGGLLLKGITSFGFVLIAAVNLIYAIRAKADAAKFPVVMTVGLVLCMVADIVLNISFIPGALIFAAGHVFYFISYCRLAKFKATDTIPSVIIFAASAALITLVPIFDFGSMLMEIICLGYALVISLMVGKAVSNLIGERNKVNAILAAGSVMFYFSDLMLLFNVFAGAPKITDTLCLFTYYPAQCLLAYSIFQFANDTTVEN